MRVAILGSSGFLGTHLAARLVAEGRLGERRISDLLLFDRQVPALPAAVCPVRALTGDLREAATLQALFAQRIDCVFHLAATLTVDAESNFRRGLETNVLGFVQLLEHCRAQASAPMLLFSSSIATFGAPLPPVVGDETAQFPATSYGTHKTIAELLLADYSRHGFVDGRALRLPIVLTHPGPATGSISDRVAALIREPLRGARTCCGMAADSLLAVASVDKVVDGFLRLASLPQVALGGRRSMNLPALTVTPAQIVQAVRAHLPTGAPDPVDWQPDAALQRIVDGWPRAFVSARATSLGFAPDASAEALVQSFLAHERRAP